MMRAKTVLLLFGLGMGLALGEVGLRIAERLRIPVDAVAQIDDPRFGIRARPCVADVDCRGFRNETAADTAEIVALGDSQTWGINAPRWSAWPQRLAKHLGLSVYNMGTGGFGMVQHYLLLDQALRLRPKRLIVGLYLGNDLYDAYRIAYLLPANHTLRRPMAPPEWQHDVLRARVAEIWKRRCTYTPNIRDSWLHWLTRKSATGRLLAQFGLGNRALFRLGVAWAQRNPDLGDVVDLADIQTVFTPRYRLLALDRSEPRIEEGLRLSERLYREMDTRARAAGVSTLLVLLPTKESAYEEIMSSGGGQPSDTYRRLVTVEADVREELLRFCRSSNLNVLDVRPALSAALRGGSAMYPVTTDGHPNAAGYEAIASAVTKTLLPCLAEKGSPRRRSPVP